MKILLLPAYFYPEHGASPYLGQNLKESFAGNRIYMLLYTPTPSRGVTTDVLFEYKKRRHELLLNGYLEVHRFRLFREGKNPLLRACRYILCWFKQFWRGFFVRDIDCIFLVSTPPIQGLLGAFLGRIKKVPFIYNLQDIFPDSLVGAGLAKKGGLLWKIGRRIEDYTYRNADKIIVISEDFKRNIMAKGVSEEKIEVIYNWVDENAIVPVDDAENPLFEEFSVPHDKFRVVYAGNLGNAQNIEIIVETARRLKGEGVEFIIFGTGGLEEQIKRTIAEERLDDLRIFPLQPYERVSQVYGLGNVCVVSCKAGLGGAAMPSKTWSILSAGRAVLANFDEGELKNILERNGCGVFTPAGDVEAFVVAILELARDWAACAPGGRSHCEEMGDRGRDFILNNLTKEVGTRKYVEVIKSVAGEE